MMLPCSSCFRLNLEKEKMDIPTDQLGRVKTNFLCKEGTRDFDWNKLKEYLPYSISIDIDNETSYNFMINGTKYAEYTNWIINNSRSGWYQTKNAMFGTQRKSYTCYTFHFIDPNDAALFKLFHGDNVAS